MEGDYSTTESKALVPFQNNQEATLDVIDATPLSVRRPEDGIPKMMGKGKQVTSSLTEEQVTDQNLSQLSKSEREQGWHVEHRQRKNGKFDKYYYHLQSNLMFRSLVEVDNFKMYGIIPKRSCKPKKVKAEEYFESLDSTSTGKIRSKGKETLPSPNNPNKLKEGASSLPSKETKLIAEAFLKESYDNLMNWSDGKPKAPHGNKKRNMGEEIIEEEREQTTISTSNSAETQDDELIEAPVDFDFSSF